MKEQNRKKDIFHVLFILIIGITVLLSIIQAVMFQSWLMAFLSVVYVMIGLLFLYQDKTHIYRKMNIGHKVGLLLILIGGAYLYLWMMLNCQIPDFAMKLIWTGYGIIVISIFYDRRMAKR